MNLKHGKSKSRTYAIWCGLRARCENPNDRAYPEYGGRGIIVCARWHSFEGFYEDMGDRPAGKSLDRIDNNGPYSPENCRWANRTEQNRNKRNNRLLTAFGRTQTMAAWAEQSGLKIGTVYYRLSKGWPVEAAVSQPLVTKRAGVPRGQRFFGSERGVVWSDDRSEAA